MGLTDEPKLYKSTSGKQEMYVIDEDAIAILGDILNQLGGSAGTPIYFESSGVTTGVLQTLISEVVPALTTRTISKVIVSCRQSGVFNILLNAAVIGSGRTGPSQMNTSFSFIPGRAAAAGDTIKIEFTQSTGPSTDIECYLMATDN